jgi:hypothetical protein
LMVYDYIDDEAWMPVHLLLDCNHS